MLLHRPMPVGAWELDCLRAPYRLEGAGAGSDSGRGDEPAAHSRRCQGTGPASESPSIAPLSVAEGVDTVAASRDTAVRPSGVAVKPP